MVIRVRPSELFRGQIVEGHCAIERAVRRARPDVRWKYSGLFRTYFGELPWQSSVAHTAFGRLLVVVHDAFPKLRFVLVPFLWLPVINAPEGTFAIPPDRIITVPEPEREAWPIPQEQPVTAPAIELPVEEPAGVPA